ncbi:MAG: hypothetical protein H7Y13_17680 [Sphingobacteriaceae bacterium]|nr:hypothetical protein [Sphingobacteriaceae bacterium]
MEENKVLDEWEKNINKDHSHLMSSVSITFTNDECKKFALSNTDMMFNDIQIVFEKYGIKSADLRYDYFNTMKG